VWSRHSCPLPLVLILVLLLFLVLLPDSSEYGTNQEQPQSQKRRTRVSAPHECGRVGVAGIKPGPIMNTVGLFLLFENPTDSHSCPGRKDHIRLTGRKTRD